MLTTYLPARTPVSLNELSGATVAGAPAGDPEFISCRVTFVCELGWGRSDVSARRRPVMSDSGITRSSILSTFEPATSIWIAPVEVRGPSRAPQPALSVYLPGSGPQN